MGRAKHEHLWIHVRKVENGRKWICKHCNVKFSGGASRIQTHIGGKGGGGIRRCSNYHANDGIHNMASTSSNSPEVVINRVYSTQDQGVNGSSFNRNVFESESNQLKQLVIDLECEERDIRKQLQWLVSRGKKRKPKVDEWLDYLLELKERVDDMNNLEDIDEINELIKDLKQHKEDRLFTLSSEFVVKKLDFNVKKVLKLLVKRKTTFNDVFWVTVSDNTNISKLQHDIAKRIGVKLDEDDERIRADYLSSTLERKGKSILILDDVWKYIDLEKMDCQPYVMIEMFPLSCYNEDEYQYADQDEFDVDEDWDLFTINLGHGGTPRVLPYEIEKVARCIVERFQGLPLGIKVMARIMKGINDIQRWKHALHKLNKLEMGEELEEEVFKVLKRSYDDLKERDLQNCFLYCAILSDDMECLDYELIMKLVDNGLINGNRCLEEISDEVKVMLKRLEAHSLDYTHGLVKDMACYILKETKRNVMLKLYIELTEIPLAQEWVVDLEIVHFQYCSITLFKKIYCSIKEIPDGMSPYCPRVEDIQGMKKLERFGGIFDIKDYHNYVQKMPELKMYYLIFRNVCGESGRYAPLVQQLQNLDTLSVSSCASMTEIFAVSNNDENESSFIELPKFNFLCLTDLPQLKTVCKRSIRCGSSKASLSIHRCPELERHPTVKLIEFEIPYFGIFTTDIDPQLMLLDTLVNLQ
ncbi:Ulp1 peptidase [Trifolium repens]|nr:Ulp1 peptidase [Trifolium repens]